MKTVSYYEIHSVKCLSDLKPFKCLSDYSHQVLVIHKVSTCRNGLFLPHNTALIMLFVSVDSEALNETFGSL